MFTAEKQNPERYFCHSFRVFPPFSQLLSCWILEIYCLFSDLIGWIISKQMPWLVKKFFHLVILTGKMLDITLSKILLVDVLINTYLVICNLATRKLYQWKVIEFSVIESCRYRIGGIGGLGGSRPSWICAWPPVGRKVFDVFSKLSALNFFLD